MHNFPNTMLHNAHLPINHVKVGIDVALDGDTLLPIPIKATITTRDAIGIKSKVRSKQIKPRNDPIGTPLRKEIGYEKLKICNLLKMHGQAMGDDLCPNQYAEGDHQPTTKEQGTN
ncbi:hypothetical protein Lal_00030214 [Lupinus albus]|nr:hypothetical protein Lal_00030214 [Lupinus albus]